jgi:hypothetical protein
MAKKYLPRNVNEVITWSRNQVKDPTQDWTGLCQSHCRQAYGVGPWAASAIIAWRSIPAAQKTIGGKPSDAPRGSLLYFDIGQFGHVAIAIGKRTHGSCLSNDYVRRGMIDACSREFPRWGVKYLGWSAFTPYGSLRLDHEL